jgi:2-octaprenyl-6-methoxyphenol hydroxylase
LSGRLDVLIRGAGPVGCTLALALRTSGLRVAVVDSAFRNPGFRPIALSYASRLILERIGAWVGLAATPIETVEVSQAGGFGRTHLAASDAGVPALGYVTEYSSLLENLRSRLHELASREEGEAACVVHAEGSAADPADKRYAQDALVALVRTEPAARARAFERFTPEGPLALLPLEGRYALIWCLRPERAQRLAAAPPAALLGELSAATGGRAGRALEVEALGVQPLSLRVRAARIAQRSVYIGNAAQTLHPVAGQGLNLGLRDAWELAQVLRGAADPGDAATLERYAARRRLDAAATVRVTDWLAGGFLGSGRAARAARGAALTALDLLPGPRRFFARRMIFGPFALP